MFFSFHLTQFVISLDNFFFYLDISLPTEFVLLLFFFHLQIPIAAVLHRYISIILQPKFYHLLLIPFLFLSIFSYSHKGMNLLNAFSRFSTMYLYFRCIQISFSLLVLKVALPIFWLHYSQNTHYEYVVYVRTDYLHLWQSCFRFI